MNSRRLLPVLTAALIALLVFAASAAAEVRTGEGTSPTNESLPKDLDILKATASFDSATGTDSFTVTTGQAPMERSGAGLFVGLFTVQGTCRTAAFEGGEESAVFPFFGIESNYLRPTQANEVEAGFFFVEKKEGPPAEEGPASKSITGTATTLTATAAKAVNRPLNCALVETFEPGENGSQGKSDVLIFPIAVHSEPTPPAPERIVEVQTVTKTVTVPAPTPPQAPLANLSISRIRPTNGSSEKFATVRLTVTNTGGTASGPVGIKVKAPKGVIVKPATLRLPALLPGQAWTLPVRVKVTEAAKTTSEVTLTATLPGVTTSSSFTVKSTD